MRKIILLILTGLLTLVNAQQQNSAEMNMGITQPNPTASSMSSYANVPVSFQTGIPNISYDLFTVPTNHKKVNIKLALNYHAGGIGSSQWVGDLGQGWSLLGLGAVSREIYGDIDERFSQSFLQYYKKNIFDDIYSFSTLEESGRFKFKRDTVNNIFSLRPVSDYASRIEYERTSDNKTLVLNSFTVTGTSGVKYKYTLHDKAVQTNVFMHYTSEKVKAKDGITDSLISKPKYLDLDYRSSFRLASILDENNIEIVKYNYESYNDVVGTSSITQKLRSIEIKDHGKIEINYASDIYPKIRNHENLNIGSIILKDINGIQTQKYVFNYDGDYSGSAAYGVKPRQLTSYAKVDKNNNIVENTHFNYNLISYPIKPNNNIYTYIWHLKNVILPSGGKIDYDFSFEPNYWNQLDTTTPKYVDLSTVTFNEYSINKKPFFTLNEDKTVIISLQNQAPGQFWEFNLYKKNGNSYDLISPVLGYFNTASSYSLSSGEYYASLHYNRANPPAFTEATVFTSVYQDGFEKYTEASEQGFLRINNIKYYSDSNSTPDLNEAYDYRDFEDSSKSSGHIVGNCLYLDLGLGESSPVSKIYKNIKVSGKGYTKYYYKIPEDYPLIETNYYTQRENHYSTQGGVLDKTEIYNDNHQKLKEIKHTYNFVDFGDFLPEAGLFSYGERYRLSYTQSEKTVTKDFLPTGISETQNEIIRNDISNINKNNVTVEKQTDSDQTVTETHYQYAAEKSNYYLTDKNIVSTILETEVKRNGKMISKTETIYPTNQSAADTKTAGKVLPLSIYTANYLGVMSTDLTYDLYDSKGNILQYSTREGVPTAVVWGYHSTRPIAKITGITYSLISSLVSDIVSASDADINAATEQNLIDKLDAFRNHSVIQNAETTTYTYDPLTGVTTTTSPSGIREVYMYDAANRLKEIRQDTATGKTVKEFKYNYKH